MRTISWVAMVMACSHGHRPKALENGNARLTIPAGADASKQTVSVQAGLDLPSAAERYTDALKSHYQLVEIVALEPAGLVEEATLSVGVLPAQLPAGRTTADLIAIEVAGNDLEDLSPAHVGDRVELALHRLGVVVLAVPLPNVDVLGSAAAVLHGAPDFIVSKDCAGWLTPDSPGVAAVAKDPSKLAIEPDGTIRLAAPLARTGHTGSAQLHADEILARGSGDATDAAVVLGSLLLARGSSVQLVAGDATFAHGARSAKGVLVWAEAIVDGKRMYVDTSDGAHPRLVPSVDATKRYALEPHRTCAKYPKGASTDPMQWSDEPPAPPPPAAPPPPDPAALLAQRKQLDKQCNHGADKAACMERGKLDDQLKKLLDALLAEHKDLETKCKANSDAGACARRDQIAAQGKAIKAQLDAKP